MTDETVEKIRKTAGDTFALILLRRLVDAEQHYEDLDGQLQEIHAILGFDTNDPVESARQASDEIRLLHQRAAEALANTRALLEVEWVRLAYKPHPYGTGVNQYDYYYGCPWCRGQQPPRGAGHAIDCPRQAAAKSLEGKGGS